MRRLIHQMISLILSPKQILHNTFFWSENIIIKFFLNWTSGNLVGCTKIGQNETILKKQKLP